MSKPGHEELDAQPTSTLTPDELHQINAIVGRLHAVLKEAQTTMEKLGNADPHPQWKTWMLENSKVIGAMRRKLFTYAV